ncbi:hypothetical protein BH18THE1_BH18THE1_09090 [soil metagenome]
MTITKIMDCDFCRKECQKDKSFYSPSGADPREYHICIDCIKSWLREVEQ